MIRYYPSGDIALHVRLIFNPIEKTLRLERRFDGEPVDHKGWTVPMSLELDWPGGEMVSLLLQEWLAQKGPTPEEMARYGRDADGNRLHEPIDIKDYCDHCGRADDECTCDDD